MGNTLCLKLTYITVNNKSYKNKLIGLNNELSTILNLRFKGNVLLRNNDVKQNIKSASTITWHIVYTCIDNTIYDFEWMDEKRLDKYPVWFEVGYKTNFETKSKINVNVWVISPSIIIVSQTNEKNNNNNNIYMIFQQSPVDFSQIAAQ